MTTNQIREVFQQLDASRAQEIREAYYDTIAGLQNLVTALEVADAERSTPEGDFLLNEHLLACAALDVMNKSQLGKVL